MFLNKPIVDYNDKSDISRALCSRDSVFIVVTPGKSVISQVHFACSEKLLGPWRKGIDLVKPESKPREFPGKNERAS